MKSFAVYFFVFKYFELISVYFQPIKMECQVEKNEHFLYLLFTFKQGSKATKAACNSCAVYGKGTIAERTACYWHAKFKNKNLTSKIHLILAV